MDTRKLGNSDLMITPVGYGAWAIGGGGWQFGWGPQDDQQSIEAIRRALELRVNWIDTAAVYGLGHSEEIIARALEGWKGTRPFVSRNAGCSATPTAMCASPIPPNRCARNAKRACDA